MEVYLAVFASPDKVCFTSAATHFVEFLIKNCELPGAHSGKRKRQTHKAVHPDIVVMSLSARSTLHLEHVPERVILRVVGAQVGDAVFSCERIRFVRRRGKTSWHKPRKLCSECEGEHLGTIRDSIYK